MGDEQKPKPVFSRQSVQEKQERAKADYENQVRNIRKAFEQVASTPSGAEALRYLYLICGGDLGTVRRRKDSGVVDVNETMLSLGAQSVWEALRFNLASETLKTIERHEWEDKK